MLRWVGVALTLLASVGIGGYYGAMAKGRLDDLKDLKKTMLRMRGEIEYAATPLPIALSFAARHAGKRFQGFYGAAASKLAKMDGLTFRSIWKECVEKELEGVCLSKKDKAELLRFGEGLGYLDKDMQIRTIDWYLSELEQEIKGLAGEINQKIKLCNVLGLMGGLFLVVLFWA